MLFRFIVFLVFLSALPAHAYEFAYSVSNSTIVYADKALKIPIGYIKKGRKLIVGKAINEKNTIVPILISGKIAFVKKKDVTFKYENNRLRSAPVVREHNDIVEEANYTEKILQNTFIRFDYSTFDGGASWKEYTDHLEGTEYSSFTKIAIGLENRTIESNHGFGVALSYISSTNDAATLKTVTFGGDYQYRLFHIYQTISLEGYIGAFFGSDVRIDTNRDEELFASLVGFEYGARVRIFPYRKFNFYGKVGFNNYSTFNADPATNSSDKDKEIDGFGGLEINLGLSYKL